MLNCGGRSATVLDLYGREVLRGGNEGLLQVPLGIAPYFITGAELGALKTLLSFRAGTRKLLACPLDGSVDFAIAAINAAARPLKGTLTLDVPEGWETSPEFLVLSLAPGEARDISLELQASEASGPVMVCARFSAKGQDYPSVARGRACAYAPEAPFLLSIGEERVLEDRRRSISTLVTCLKGKQTGHVRLRPPDGWRSASGPAAFTLKEGQTKRQTLLFLRGDLTARPLDLDVVKDGPAVLSRRILLERQSEWSAPSDLIDVKYLCDLRPTEAKTGHGKLLSPAAMKIRGQEYKQALYAHACSEVTFSTPKGYSFFECDIGIRDGAKTGGTARFEVHLNGKLAYRSQLITRNDPAPVHVGVVLPAGEEEPVSLKLVTTDAGDGNACDWTVWGNPRLPSEVP